MGAPQPDPCFPATAEGLARHFLGRDDAFWGIREDPQLGGAAFADSGYSATQCTGYACAIHRQLGGARVQVVGFSLERNPASAIAADVFGHDFAVVDHRFIVDPWLVDVHEMSDRGVFDLADPGDAAEIARLYGPVAAWGVATVGPEGTASFAQPAAFQPSLVSAREAKEHDLGLANRRLADVRDLSGPSVAAGV